MRVSTDSAADNPRTFLSRTEILPCLRLGFVNDPLAVILDELAWDALVYTLQALGHVIEESVHDLLHLVVVAITCG